MTAFEFFFKKLSLMVVIWEPVSRRPLVLMSWTMRSTSEEFPTKGMLGFSYSGSVVPPSSQIFSSLKAVHGYFCWQSNDPYHDQGEGNVYKWQLLSLSLAWWLSYPGKYRGQELYLISSLCCQCLKKWWADGRPFSLAVTGNQPPIFLGSPGGHRKKCHSQNGDGWRW